MENPSIIAVVFGWFKLAMFIIGCCNLATIWTPTNSNKPVVQGIFDILNIGSLNVWKNTNKDESRP